MQKKNKNFSLNSPEPENIPLNIVFEDEHLIIINKPAGIAVHPAPGNPDHTVVNALLHYTKNLSTVNGPSEPGIVHRLDKDTSGLMIIAKNNKTHLILSNQIARRQLKRIYWAVVWGHPETRKGFIDAPIGRSRKIGLRYAVTHLSGKPAKTFYKTLEIYRDFSLLELSLLTGRTHQIRLHLAHIGLPVVGDRDYCGRMVERKLQSLNKYNPELFSIIQSINNQMLYARSLQFKHPITNKPMFFSADPPDNFLSLIKSLLQND